MSLPHTECPIDGSLESSKSTLLFLDHLQNTIASGIQAERRNAEEVNSQELSTKPPTVNKKIIVSEVDNGAFTYLDEPDENNRVETKKPWKQNPYYFQTVHVSMLAMNKMTTHAISGGSIEIMGMLLGYHRGSDLYILDCYPLPVQGTESRVNPQNDSYEFMLQYLTKVQESGVKKEHIIGWYHSHPGFGCWLSGIDVQTQKLHQSFEDPYVAIVIDPHKSIRDGTIAIGAFRTFYDGCKLDEKETEDQKTMGWHSGEYYPLDVKMFVNKFDKLLLDCVEAEDSTPLSKTVQSITSFADHLADQAENVSNAYDSLKIAKRMLTLVENVQLPTTTKALDESNEKQFSTDNILSLKMSDFESHNSFSVKKISKSNLLAERNSDTLTELIKAGIAMDLDTSEQLQRVYTDELRSDIVKFI